jgi:hypothetical protein
VLHLGARVCESTFWRSRRRHRPARCRLTSAHRVERAADRRLGCAERLEDQDFELAQSCHTAGTKRNTGLFPFRVRSVACAANKGSSVHASCHARRMTRNRSRHVASCVPRGIVWHHVCRVASCMPRGIVYAAWHRVCRVASCMARDTAVIYRTWCVRNRRRRLSSGKLKLGCDRGFRIQRLPAELNHHA